MITENKNIKLKIKITGYKQFYKEYKLLISKYNNIVPNNKLLEEAIKNNDIGTITEFNNIISNKDILDYKDYFIIIE